MKRFAISLALATATLSAYCQSAPVDAPVKTTLCEIKAHPERFQHKLVEFRATASYGFEDSMVEDATCRWGNDENPGIWMDFGSKRTTRTKYCCGDTTEPTRSNPLRVEGIEVPLVDDDLFKQFDAALHANPKPGQSVTVDATLRGRFFASRVKYGRPEHWGGYGHMGCCMLFVVTQVISVGETGTRPD